MSDILERSRQLSPLKRALFTIERLQTRLEAAERASSEPVAIVGMGCRFPGGADDPERFWRQLVEGVDAIREVPPERWDIEQYYDPDPEAAGKMYTRWGGFLERVDQFDAAFFGIAPREAVSMDPQQRLLLEVAWEALEHAGLAPDRLRGSRTGVFVGITNSDYLQLLIRNTNPADLDAYYITGNSLNAAAGRLSYLLGLQGPSLAVDTACSSSLVALHLACQSLRQGECDLALAGGVNLTLLAEATVTACKGRFLAPDGRCKTFDARADGYVRGEGCGVVVLKRVSAALAAGDRVLAVVRGSAVNQDGPSSGLTVPNGLAQRTLLREALGRAGVAPAQVQYVEAHGTGTALGDPIEVAALTSVLGEGRTAAQPLVLGSVKTNIGHLEAAAGIAGVIKTVLALQHGQIPPNLHFTQLNPHIALGAVPVEIATALRPWPAGGERRIAGVSSFGVSGTNAHVVLEQAPPRPAPLAAAPAPSPLLLPLSARSPLALRDLARAFLALPSHAPFPALARATALHRAHLPHRLAVVAADTPQLQLALAAFLEGQPHPGLVAPPAFAPVACPGPVFVCPGQGAQWPGMARRLFAYEPAFQQAFRACADALAPHLEDNLLDLLLAEVPVAPQVDAIDRLQPLLWAIQVSLAALWRHWGVVPAAVLGHSLGEVAAASIAGALSLPDAALVVATRSRLLRRLCGRGAMALVELGEAEAAAVVAGREHELAVAVLNSPRASVLSGEPTALEAVLQRLAADGVFCRRVKVDVAAHSPQVEPLGPELRAALSGLRPRAGELPLYSTVSGRVLSGEELDGDYWVANLRQPVRFAAAVGAAVAAGQRLFVELSPHPLLVGALEENLRAAGVEGWAVSSLRREEDERGALLGSLGRLYTLGQDVAWRAVLGTAAEGRWGDEGVSLPRYPWQRERFWPEVGRARRGGRENGGGLGRYTLSALRAETHLWDSELWLDELPHLRDHRVGGQQVLAGAEGLARALEAAGRLLGREMVELREVVFEELLGLREGRGLGLQVGLERVATGRYAVQVAGREVDGSEGWRVHLRAEALGAEAPAEAEELGEARERCSERVGREAFYEALAEQGLEYGPAYQGVAELWRGRGEAVGRLERRRRPGWETEGLAGAELDAGLQVLAGALADEALEGIYLPVGVERLWARRGMERLGWAHARLREGGAGEQVLGDVTLFDDAGIPAIVVKGLRMQRLTRAAPSRTDDPLAEWLYQLEWEEQAQEAGAAREASGAWLLLADQGGVGAALARALSQGGAEHVVCLPSSESWQGLLQPSAGGTWRGIVHLLALDEPELRTAEEALALAAGGRAWQSALELVQALARSGAREQPRLWLVTAGAQAVGNEGGELALGQAPLAGLARVVAHEHPGLRCTQVDLSRQPDEQELAALMAELLADGPETLVALRGSSRAVARLVPLTLHNDDNSASDGDDSLCAGVRSDGTYLVTGGLGGLGLTLAGYLARRGAGRLALVGRRSPAPEALPVLEQIRQTGTELVVAQVDVSDPGQLASLLEDLRASGPPLRGLFHAAGLLDDGLLTQLDRERFARVLAPKVSGAWLLHLLTADDPLEQFVLFSSSASLLGSPGQGNHAAANAFLDALAWWRRGRGLPALSVNWGPWAEVGAAARPEIQARFRRSGLGSIAPEQGLALLERLLRAAPAQVAVIPLDLKRLRRFNPEAARAPLFARIAQRGNAVDGGQETAGLTLTRAALLAVITHERQGVLERYLADHIARQMGFAPSRLNLQQALTDLGLDSLMALRLKHGIEADLGVTLPVAKLFEGVSVAQLAAYLLVELTGEAPTVPQGAPVNEGRARAAARKASLQRRVRPHE